MRGRQLHGMANTAAENNSPLAVCKDLLSLALMQIQ